MSTIKKQRPDKSKYLQEDIMIQILLRLQVDSVLALKCVSKQWYNLIVDPKFFNIYHTNTMAFYLHNGTLNCALFNHSRIDNIWGRIPPYTVHSLPVSSGGFGLDPELLSGWSNSIACVKTENGHFIIYNLLAGTSYTVSDAPQQQFQDSYLWLYYGFGYDRYANDYKILVVPRCDATAPSEYQNEENSLFWVYSVENRVWKTLDGFPYGAYSYHENTDIFDGAYAFNGVLHLAATENPNPVILTFDLHTSRFGEIMMPSGEESGHWKVSELDGRLCVLHQINWVVVEAWVMKDYGVVESWAKLFSFDFSRMNNRPKVQLNVGRVAYTVLYECGDGTKGVLIVSHDRKSLFWYNITNNKMKVTTCWYEYL